MDKEKFPRADAEKLAARLMDSSGHNLGCFCERWKIAGSIRRKKRLVGDIEVVYIPRMVEKKPASTVQQDFGFLSSEVEKVAALKEELDALIEKGILEKRIFEKGQTMYGPNLQFVRHVETGIPIDFFACCHETWYTTLVTRTGSAEWVKELARRANEQGYNWNPGGKGFTKMSDKSVVEPVRSEEEAFQFLGMPVLPPEEREVCSSEEA